jgi:ribonuclease-3
MQDLPFNPSNTILNESDVLNLFSKYNVETKINDINIYRKSMVHKSYCTRKNEDFESGNLKCPAKCIPLQEESNERLEFLGDAVINLIVGKYLYERYADENEGFLTKIRTKLVNGVMLAQLCSYTGLQKYLIISKQIEDNNGRNNKKLMEDLFEAFVGAMIMDLKSYDVIETWLVNLIEENINFSELISQNNNYKDMFIKQFQYKYNYLPKFLEINSKQDSNGKLYTVCIKDKNNAIISTGSGYSKKIAENNAAKVAIDILK